MISFPTSMTINNLFHLSLLNKYISYVNHVIDWNMIQVEQEGTFQVHLVHILDQKTKQLHNQAIKLVKVH
jgi:hypothetical protein